MRKLFTLLLACAMLLACFSGCAQETTEINAENYNAMVAAYNDAVASYATLTEAQQALISAETYAKVSVCKTALDAYAKVVALAELAGKIAALPAEVNAENYEKPLRGFAQRTDMI